MTVTFQKLPANRAATDWRLVSQYLVNVDGVSVGIVRQYKASTGTSWTATESTPSRSGNFLPGRVHTGYTTRAAATRVLLPST